MEHRSARRLVAGFSVEGRAGVILRRGAGRCSFEGAASPGEAVGASKRTRSRCAILACSRCGPGRGRSGEGSTPAAKDGRRPRPTRGRKGDEARPPHASTTARGAWVIASGAASSYDGLRAGIGRAPGGPRPGRYRARALGDPHKRAGRRRTPRAGVEKRLAAEGYPARLCAKGGARDPDRAVDEEIRARARRARVRGRRGTFRRLPGRSRSVVT